MYKFVQLIRDVRFWKETRAQDLIEYSLMAGFVAVAAGAIMPGVASKISIIFSKVSAHLLRLALKHLFLLRSLPLTGRRLLQKPGLIGGVTAGLPDLHPA